VLSASRSAFRVRSSLGHVVAEGMEFCSEVYVTDKDLSRDPEQCWCE